MRVRTSAWWTRRSIIATTTTSDVVVPAEPDPGAQADRRIDRRQRDHRLVVRDPPSPPSPSETAWMCAQGVTKLTACFVRLVTGGINRLSGATTIVMIGGWQDSGDAADGVTGS